MHPEILDYASSLGHTIFLNGQYNLNLIGIRNAEHQANRFDDKIHCVYKDENDKWVHKSWACTTEPGKYWLENPTNVNGTAILVPGQYRSVWKIDLHQGKYEALCQRNGTVKVYRDDNRDEIIDCDPDSITEGYYGINIHKAGANSTQIDRWSAGCQVFANESDFDEFMDICRKARETWGNAFSYTLILEDERGPE
tara:strand:+ start:2744 stop:3331 length:588 start_codon:yes stop_codon:yes gene_type:complete